MQLFCDEDAIEGMVLGTGTFAQVQGRIAASSKWLNR
jgi:hypothetical protein